MTEIPPPPVRDIFDISPEALGQLKNWIEQASINVPISQVQGATRFFANIATKISAGESTTSSTYVDLATVGPQLTNLPDGKYLLLYGCDAQITVSSGQGFMSVQVNATPASDNDACKTSNTGAQMSISTVTAVSLSNAGNSTVTAKYRGSGALTLTVANRWLIALRYANL